MEKHSPLKGLVAAVLTPLNSSQEVDVQVIPRLADHLMKTGISGIYCCGSTGEGVSLSLDERKRIAEAWVQACNGRIPVVVQVGHNCIRDAMDLAKHAVQIGASATSATCPNYFKIDSIAGLVEFMGQLAASAGELPFYYYHIPTLTGSRLSMPEFLSVGGPAIPNLVGLKYTAAELHEFLECLHVSQGRYEVIWGYDEMLLGALAMGATAAIGSTYNIAAPLYHQLIRAFQAGDMQRARQLQLRSIEMIHLLKKYPFFAAVKYWLTRQGFELGGCRTPNGNLTEEQRMKLDAELDKLQSNFANLLT